MVNKKISDEKGEVEKKEIDKLIDFLERFKEDCEIKKGDIQTYVKGHIVWKEKKTIRGNANVKKDKDIDSDEMKEGDFTMPLLIRVINLSNEKPISTQASL